MQDEEQMPVDHRAVPDAVIEVIDEHLEVEAVAQMVEQIGYSRELSARLSKAFQGHEWHINQNHRLIHLTQEELRSLLLDVELLKRAVASLGQIGVMERRRIEKELILELFPPTDPRVGAGVRIHRPASANADAVELDCARRLPICKAACCRIFDILLTPAEVESDRYNWNVRRPYALAKNRFGCTYMRAGTCVCTRYRDSRPQACTGYSCAKDRRIWVDFDKQIINPQLQERLKNLQVITALGDAPASASSVSDGGQEHAKTMQTAPEYNGSDPSATQFSRLPSGIEGAGEHADPAEGTHGETAAATTSAEPPDFSALEAMMIPEPENKFVPPTLAAPEAQSKDSCDDAHERKD